jgi:hypothetical protein
MGSIRDIRKGSLKTLGSFEGACSEAGCCARPFDAVDCRSASTSAFEIDRKQEEAVKRLIGIALACMLCLSLGACASGNKDTDVSLAELDGPLYSVKIRTMLREEPMLEAEATGVVTPGGMVHLRELNEDESWALVTAPGAGDVVFKGWLPSSHIKHMED